MNKSCFFGMFFVGLALLAVPTHLSYGQDEPIEEWVATYGGPEIDDDSGQAIAVDGSGNVYVTGYVRGSSAPSDWDCATVKYDTDGNELWAATYSGPGTYYDMAYDIALDSSDNVYVTGATYTNGVGHEYLTLKYDTNNGDQLWVATYPGGIGYAAAVDSSDNVYVTGGGPDYTTLKYDKDGNLDWVATYNSPDNKNDYARAIAVDSLDNVFVTGQSADDDTSWDYATIKYDSDGNECWVRRYSSSGMYYDAAHAIAVDGSGNVYVTGRSGGWSLIPHDYATVKYDTNGNELWVAVYDGPINGDDVAWDIAVDSLGSVYVTGTSEVSGIYDHDYATVKYDTNGNELWKAMYDGPGTSDCAFAIAVDGLGNVYVTGASSGIGTGNDYATVKYDSDGTERWEARYTGGGDDVAYDIAVDSLNNVYITGKSWDITTIKYSQYCANPMEAIADLIALVESLNLQHGIDNSLDAKLTAVLQVLDDVNENNNVAAINALGAFISAVEAQSGNHITEADANSLIAAAQQIMDMLNTYCQR